MKKWKCKDCPLEKPCLFETDDRVEFPPCQCPSPDFSRTKYANWEEVE